MNYSEQRNKIIKEDRETYYFKKFGVVGGTSLIVSAFWMFFTNQPIPKDIFSMGIMMIFLGCWILVGGFL